MAIVKGRAGNLAETLSDNWWVLLLRGIVAILFGILTFARPGITLATLVLLFGLFALADGLLASYTAVTHRHDRENWGMLLLGGLVGIGVGILTWVSPSITALALVFYIAIWAIATGALAVVAGIRLRHVIQGEWRLVLAGVVGLAFGVFLMARPGAGAISVVWMIGSFAFVFGIANLALAFKMRSVAHHLEARLA